MSTGPEKTRRCILRTRRFGTFLLRHSIALIVVVIAACVTWTAVFLALFLWALIANHGLGSPVAYPIGLLMVFGTSILLSLGMFLPATALSEWIAGRCRWPVLAQIPLSLLMLAILCLIAALMLVEDQRAWFLKLPVAVGLLVAGSLIPFGIYWWTAQAAPLIGALFSRLKTRRQKSGP